jgi:hypothetical protein
VSVGRPARPNPAHLALFGVFLSLGACELVFPLEVAPAPGEAGDATTPLDATDSADASLDAMDAADTSLRLDAEAGHPPTDSSTLCGDGASYRTSVLCDNPIAYWRLGDPGPATAADEVDGGPPGTYIGPATVAGISYGAPGAILGDPDTAIHLGGSGWVASDAGRFEFTGNAEYTLEAWVSPDAPDTNGTIVARYASSGPVGKTGYRIVNLGAALSTDRYTADASVSAAGNPLPAGVYTYVVATYNYSMQTGGELTLWVNRNPVTKMQTLISLDVDNAIPFLIGASGLLGNPIDPWTGSIDEVAVYAGLLPEERIYAHFHAAGH